jgi:hypothetical protein
MMPAAVMDSAVANITPASACRLNHASIFMEMILTQYIWLHRLPTTTESHSKIVPDLFVPGMPDFRLDPQVVEDSL